MQFSRDQVENSFSLFTGFSVVENTGVSSDSLLQGIFPIQGSNSGLMHCRQILYCHGFNPWVRKIP